MEHLNYLDKGVFLFFFANHAVTFIRSFRNLCRQIYLKISSIFSNIIFVLLLVLVTFSTETVGADLYDNCIITNKLFKLAKSPDAI